jgi:hypothetical protein
MKRHGPFMAFFMVAMGMASVAQIAQTPATKKPSFDVISVKPDKAGGPPRRTGTEGNRFIAENVPLILLIQYAYLRTRRSRLMATTPMRHPTGRQSALTTFGVCLESGDRRLLLG